MSTILWTGDRGFIAGYAIQKLLDAGHTVVGIDSDWKYGPVQKSYDDHQHYRHFVGDAKHIETIEKLIMAFRPQYFVMGAAQIGGISLFHELAYDLLAENERLTATAFDCAIKYYKEGIIKKVIAISSSMVYESAVNFPSVEGDERVIPPPLSTYGFQKLAVEYFVQGAHEQYGLPYTIVRPFNCVGTGEQKAVIDKEVMSGNIKLAMSHVVPDLIQKILKGQDPLHILGTGHQLRYYTYGGDLADGFIKCIFNANAENHAFNLSTSQGHTVLELAQIILNKIHPGKQLEVICDKPFKYDVQTRMPDTIKAKLFLGFEAKTSLEKALDEIIPWATKMIEAGKL